MSYDIRPGNVEDLFLFRRFINQWLTLTHLQPLCPHGVMDFWRNFTKWLFNCPPHLQNITALHCETQISFIRWKLHRLTSEKQPVVVLYANLNLRQATSQKLLNMTVFCVDTRFYCLPVIFAADQSYYPPHSAGIQPMFQLLASRCHNSSTSRIGTWYTRFCIRPHIR